MTFLWKQDWIPNLFLTFHSPSPLCLLGGAIGGLYSWLTSKEFKSVPEILEKMSDDQRKKLFDAIRAVLPTEGWETAAQLILAVNGRQDIKRTIINLLIRMLM